MTKRYRYQVIINEKKIITKDKCFYYNYGNTKNIEISIFNDTAIITVSRTVKHKAKEVIEKNLFKDALRKALILHLLKNSENLDINKITVEVFDNGKLQKLIESTTYDCKETPVLYSMIKKKLKREIHTEWSKQEIENLLDIKKSDNDSREAALISFLNSKNKKFESERFLYLWMAFNGMYGYLGKYLAKETGEDNKYNSEAKQIRALLKYFNYKPGGVIKRYSNKLADEIKPVVRAEYTNDLTKEKLEKGEYKNLSQKIEKVIQNFYDTLPEGEDKHNKEMLLDLTGYTYLLTSFPYNFRCNYFHASEPMPLFMFADDPDFIYFKAMNGLLEEFIEDNLHEWFSDTKMNEFKEFAKKRA